MTTSVATHDTPSTRHHALLSLAVRLTGEYPNPDDETPPGPWDPVLRIALETLERIQLPSLHPYAVTLERRGADPDPWLERFSTRDLLTVIARRHPALWDLIIDRFSATALNPQPLPPRIAFAAALADAVARRAELIQDVVDALPSTAIERGHVGGGPYYVARFVDDLCPRPFKPRFPKPGPRPPWFPDTFEGLDLVAIGAAFHRIGRETYTEPLRDAFGTAATTLVDTGAGLL